MDGQTEWMEGPRQNYIPLTLSGDNNPKLDLVNINAFIKFGEILSNCSQAIERKQNFGVNQWP